MSPLSVAICATEQLILLTVAVGLLARGRWRLTWTFAAYILSTIVFSSLEVWWPSRFFIGWFWQLAQTTFDVLKFGIAIEIGFRTFRLFRGARSTALKVALVILITTAAAVAAVPMAEPQSSAYETAIAELHPRVIVGTLWLMAAVLLQARWYRVPIHPFHAAILTSLASYVAIFSAFLIVIGRYGLGSAAFVGVLDNLVYLVLAWWWSYVTWRPETARDLAHVATMRHLELGASA